MTHEPLLLPRMSPGLVRAVNRMYGGSRAVAFSSGGRGWRFRPDASVRPAVWRVRVYARLGDHDMALFLDSPVVADWEGSGLSAAAVAALPPELAGAALELVCRDLAERLEAATGLPVSVTGLNMDEEEAWLPDEGFAFTLTRDDGMTAQGAAAASTECVALLADFLEAHAPVVERDVSGVRVPCRILFSGPDLSVPELAGLEPGDVLMTGLDSTAMAGGLPVSLAVTEYCTAPARLKGAALHLEGYMTGNAPAPSAEDDMEITETNGPDEAPVPADQRLAAAAPGELPVRVAFDLGGMELTVAELAALAPGQVLASGREAGAAVSITASGRRIGTGSLVDVAGRIGVKIETLFGK